MGSCAASFATSEPPGASKELKMSYDVHYNGETSVHSHLENCPLCGQTLPNDEAARHLHAKLDAEQRARERQSLPAIAGIRPQRLEPPRDWWQGLVGLMDLNLSGPTYDLLRHVHAEVDADASHPMWQSWESALTELNSNADAELTVISDGRADP
jgi:hypothetical protein